MEELHEHLGTVPLNGLGDSREGIHDFRQETSKSFRREHATGMHGRRLEENCTDSTPRTLLVVSAHLVCRNMVHNQGGLVRGAEHSIAQTYRTEVARGQGSILETAGTEQGMGYCHGDMAPFGLLGSDPYGPIRFSNTLILAI